MGPVALYLPAATFALAAVLIFGVAQLVLPDANAPVFLVLKAAAGLLVGLVAFYLGRSYTQGAGGRSRTALGNALLWTGIIAALVVTVETNYIASRHHIRGDWTSTGFYSLSEKSEAVLAELTTPIKVVVFLSPRSELYAELFDDIRTLAAEMEARAPNLTVEYVDPDRDIEKARLLIEKYDLPPDADVVVFEAGEKVKYVGGDELGEYEMGAGFGPSPSKKLRAFKGEEAFLSAVMEVTSDQVTQLCFTTGHREASSEAFDRMSISELVDIVKRVEALQTAEVDLATAPIPATCSVVIIAGPETSFTGAEAAKVNAYLEAGGKVLALFDPYLGDPERGPRPKTGLEDTMSRWGVRVENAVVFDPENHMAMIGSGGTEALALRVVEYSTHPIVKPFSDGAPLLFRLSRPVMGVEPPPDGLDINNMMFTSELGWGEKDLSGETADPGPDDVKGPVSLAVAVDAPDKGARLVVIGNARFVDNTMLLQGVNYDLFVNAIRWLSKKEKLIAIAPKAPELVSLDLGDREMSYVFWLAVVLMPLFSVGVGATVWWSRRAG